MNRFSTLFFLTILTIFSFACSKGSTPATNANSSTSPPITSLAPTTNPTVLYEALKGNTIKTFAGVIGDASEVQISFKRASAYDPDHISLLGVGFYKKWHVDFAIDGHIYPKENLIYLNEFTGKSGIASASYEATLVSGSKIEGKWHNGQKELPFTLSEIETTEESKVSKRIDAIQNRQVEEEVAENDVSLDDQAISEVQKLWGTVYIKCGDSFYTQSGNSISQYKDLSFQAQPQQLREVDRLNGYEWIGRVYVSWRLERMINKGNVSDWYPGHHPDALVEKKRGKWTVDNGIVSFERNNTKPSCASVPQN
jgi:hypothetical protein